MLLENKILKEILEVDATENITVGEYAQRVKEILKPLRTEPFTHGFESWLQTYTLMLMAFTNKRPDIVIKKAMQICKNRAYKFEFEKSTPTEQPTLNYLIDFRDENFKE